MNCIICYNRFMEFSDWITRKYIEWRGDYIGNERSISDFAKLFGASQSLVSQWMKPKEKGGKVPRSKKYIDALIKAYGVEAYEILGIPVPLEEDVFSQLPPDVAVSFRAALAEVRSLDLNIGSATTPEDKEKIIEIFSRHGVNFNVN